MCVKSWHKIIDQHQALKIYLQEGQASCTQDLKVSQSFGLRRCSIEICHSCKYQFQEDHVPSKWPEKAFTLDQCLCYFSSKWLLLMMTQLLGPWVVPAALGLQSHCQLNLGTPGNKTRSQQWPLVLCLLFVARLID